jgi:AraC-like DNA-binding protein
MYNLKVSCFSVGVLPVTPTSAHLRDAAISLLIGGRTCCDPHWDKAADALDQCYKLYFIHGGDAHLAMRTQSNVSLRAGNAYLIPGCQIIKQWCPKRFDVSWLHFVPDSLYLSFLMSHVPRVHRWPLASLAHWKPMIQDIPRLFHPHAIWLDYRVQALIFDLIAQVFQQYNFSHMSAVDPVFEQLQPAIAYMDAHLSESLTLARIARVVHLSPNYFHQKFTRAFLMTPAAYMQQRRLNLAKQLLLSTDLTLERIASRSGFNCPFYMSRVFKARYHMPPSEFRRQAGP